MIPIEVVKKQNADDAAVFEISPGIVNLGGLNSWGVEKLAISVPEEWTGMVCTVTFTPHFSKDGNSYLIPEDGIVSVGNAITNSTGGTFVIDATDGVSYHAYSTGGKYAVYNHPEAMTDAEEPDPTAWEEFVAEVNEDRIAAEKAKDEAAAAAEKAESAIADTQAAKTDAEAAASKAEEYAGDAKAELDKIAPAVSAGITAIQSATDENVAKLDTETKADVALVKTAGSTAITAMDGAKTAAVGAIETKANEVTDDLNALKNGALAAITTAGENACIDVNEAKSNAVDVVSAAGDKVAKAIEDTEAGAVAAVNAAGTAQKTAIENAGQDKVALAAAEADRAAGQAVSAADSATQAAQSAESIQVSAEQIAKNTATIGNLAGAYTVTESGNPLTVKPDAVNGGKAAALVLNGKTRQSGSGDPSPTNIRPIHGVGCYDKCFTIDGTQTLFERKRNNTINSYFIFFLNGNLNTNYLCETSLFKNGNPYNNYGDCAETIQTGDQVEFRIGFSDLSIATVEQAAKKLADNPITFWYRSTDYDTATTFYAVAEFEDSTGYHATAVELDAPLFDGDTVDFVSGKAIGRYVEIVLTGTETNWEQSEIIPSVRRLVRIPNIGHNTHIVADRYINRYSNDDYSAYSVAETTERGRLIIIDSRFTSVADYSAYLAEQYAAGTPVTFLIAAITPTETQGTPQEIPLENPTTITAENMLDCTYNKSIGSAIEEIKTAIAALGTV